MQKDIKGQDFSFILLWEVDVGAFFVPLTQPLYKATKIPASLLRSLQVVWHQNNLQKIFSALMAKNWENGQKTEKSTKLSSNGFSNESSFKAWIFVLNLNLKSTQVVLQCSTEVSDQLLHTYVVTLFWLPQKS